MRFIMVGAGAIGTAMGGYLAKAGFPVVLIARPAHVSAIRDRGLTLRTAKGIFQPDIAALESLQDVKWTDDDIIFLTCKSQDTQGLLATMNNGSPATPVFCFQNGVRNEEWAATMFRNVYAGLVQISATFSQPGVVEHTRNDVLAIGKFPSGLDETTTRVGAALERAGFRVSYYEKAMPRKWGKLLVNLNNALYALIDTWLQLAYTDVELRAVLAATMKEGLDVIHAAGVEIEMGPGEPAAEEFIRQMADGAFAYPNPSDLPPERRTYPSTWQDVVMHRKTTEVEHFNGEIVRLAQQCGIPAPYNTAVLQMMRELLARNAMPGLFTLSDVQARVRQLSDKRKHAQ
jgi:2-dehydropantoate 2-reductase